MSFCRWFPAAGPAAGPAAERTALLAAEPAVEPAAEPAVEPAAEPAVEPAVEPTGELEPGKPETADYATSCEALGGKVDLVEVDPAQSTICLPVNPGVRASTMRWSAQSHLR